MTNQELGRHSICQIYNGNTVLHSNGQSAAYVTPKIGVAF